MKKPSYSLGLLVIFFGFYQSEAWAYFEEKSLTVSIDNPDNALSDTLNGFKMAGIFRKYTKSKNIVDFQCTNASVRIELCTSDIFRIRMSHDGKFKPDEQYVVIRYDWPATLFTISDEGEFIGIKTERMLIKAFKSPFRFEFFDLEGIPVNKDWKEGSMGFRGDEVICKK